jgi:cyclopropane fatty-acyl-phospholipid synthase-like methyltransferase
MGPHALWLLEWLAPALGLDRLRPGARVLDLGCGRAMTSVFLAREYGGFGAIVSIDAYQYFGTNDLYCPR